MRRDGTTTRNNESSSIVGSKSSPSCTTSTDQSYHHNQFLRKQNNHFESYSTIVLGCGDNSKYQLAVKNRGIYDDLMPLNSVEEMFSTTRTTLSKGTTAPPPKLSDIACGEKHAIMLLENGSVLSVGDNSYCQLALDQFYLSEVNKFTKSSLRNDIVKVSSKYNHSIFLTRDGRLYSCSNVNHCGQLGIGSFMSSNVCYPISCFFGGERNSLLYHLPNNKNFRVIDIATGKNHSLFLAEKYNPYNSGQKEFIVFGCGDSSMGQLSNKLQGHVNSPQEIKKFEEPIKKIDCGLNHSAVLLESGKLFMFGSNEKNQCAPSLKISKLSEPTLLMEGLYSDVQCGNDHTVMVSLNRHEISITSAKNTQCIVCRIAPNVKIAAVSTLSNSRTVLLTQNESSVFVNILNSEGIIESAWEYSQNRVIPKVIGPDFNEIRSRKPKHDHSCECGCFTTKLRLCCGQQFMYIAMERYCHTIFQKLGNGSFCDLEINFFQ